VKLRFGNLLNAEEYVNFVNQSIAPESGLRRITVADVHNWTDKGLLKPTRNYYRCDIQIALSLLQLEREAQSRNSTIPQHVQPHKSDQTKARDRQAMFQKGITQVVTCVSSNFSEEQRIIKALKDTGLISSAGHVAVNFYPFSSKPIQIPSDGVEANEGNALVFETDGSTTDNLSPVTTPVGSRLFTEDGTFFKKIRDSDSVWGHELLPGIEHLVPPEIAEQMRSAAHEKRKHFAKPVYTFPVIVPILKISNIPATMVDLVYLAQNRQRIPPLPEVGSILPPRLYHAFLETNSSSMQSITSFAEKYGLVLRFKFPDNDPQIAFSNEQLKMKQALNEAGKGNLSFENVRQMSPAHEDTLVEADFIEDLLSVPDYADCISDVYRTYGREQQTTRFIPVRRYYSWFDYMWTEMLEDISVGLIPPLCKGCGKILVPPTEGKPGRAREYCEACELSREKDRVRKHRRKVK
jgi:hypothetical protein